MAKQQRQVFHSILKKGEWVVEKGGKVQSRHGTQAESEAAAKTAGRAAYQSGGLGQAVMHKSDGVIRTEHTYGKDPEKTPG